MIKTEKKLIEEVERAPQRQAKAQRKAPRKRRARKNQDNSAKVSGLQQSVGLAQQTVTRMLEPRIEMRSGPTGSCMVYHEEYITDLSTVAALDYQRLFQADINPGDPGTFPWLSAMARRYEKYIPHRLEFQFRSTRSALTDGSVMVVVDYEANDSFPTTKRNFLNQKGAVRSAPWQNCQFVADPKDLKQRSQYYINSGTVRIQSLPAGGGTQGADDPRLDDIGQIFVAASGCPANTDLGELWVVYQVELITPQLGNDPLGVAFLATSTTLGVTPGQPFGIDPVFSGKLDIDYTVASGGGQSTWVFHDVGRFFCAYDIDASYSGINIALAAPVGGGLPPTFVTSLAGVTQELSSAASSQTGIFVIDVPSSLGRMVITATTLTAFVNASISIIPIGSGYIPF